MSDQRQAISNWFKMYARKIVVALIAISIAIGAWANLLLHINTSINTENQRDFPSILAVEINKYLIKEKAKKDFTTIAKPDYSQTFLF